MPDCPPVNLAQVEEKLVGKALELGEAVAEVLTWVMGAQVRPLADRAWLCACCTEPSC